MITIKTMYEIHTVKQKVELEALDIEITNISVPYNKLVNYFKHNVPNLIACPSSLEDILNNKGVAYSFPISNIEKYYNLQLTNYNKIYPLYTNKAEERQKIKGYKMKAVVFAYILKRFNELLVEEIVYNSYKFFSLYIGGLYSFCNKNKKSVDWGNSIKNKQALIKEGKIPYNKADEDQAIKEGKVYEGVEWLVYQPEYSLFYKWEVESTQFIRIPNIANFLMQPYRGVKSSVQILSDYRKTLSEEQMTNLYKTQNHVS